MNSNCVCTYIYIRSSTTHANRSGSLKRRWANVVVQPISVLPANRPTTFCILVSRTIRKSHSTWISAEVTWDLSVLKSMSRSTHTQSSQEKFIKRPICSDEDRCSRIIYFLDMGNSDYLAHSLIFEPVCRRKQSTHLPIIASNDKP